MLFSNSGDVDMRALIALTLVMFVALLALSCIDSPVGAPMPSAFAPVVNAPWTLTRAIIADTAVDLTHHRPFYLFVNDSLLYGRDGCNYYWCEYRLDWSGLNISRVAHTEMGCTPAAAFNVCHLLGGWQFTLQDTILTFASSEMQLTFSSSFLCPVGAYPFTGGSWVLNRSNDPAFDSLRTAGLLPQITIGADRHFAIEWYFPPRNPASECNSVSGCFGIGPNQTIYFWAAGGAYLGSPLPGTDTRLINRMALSTTFTYSDTVFTLVLQPDELFYDFVPLDRARLYAY
jgi:heat shock protein HslJ